jgi:hypothetical protein
LIASLREAREIFEEWKSSADRSFSQRGFVAGQFGEDENLERSAVAEVDIETLDRIIRTNNLEPQDIDLLHAIIETLRCESHGKLAETLEQILGEIGQVVAPGEDKLRRTAVR